MSKAFLQLHRDKLIHNRDSPLPEEAQPGSNLQSMGLSSQSHPEVRLESIRFFDNLHSKYFDWDLPLNP